MRRNAAGLAVHVNPSITIHRTSGVHASPTPVDSPYDRLGTVRAAHRCLWTSIRRTPSHKAATNPGRPAALVFAVMQPHHRPHRRHPGRRTPWSKRYHPSQRFPGSALEPPSMHSHRRRDAPVPRRSQPDLHRFHTLRDRTQPCANCRLTHRCFARRITHACSSPKRRPIPASPPASSKPSAARTVASPTVLSPYAPAVRLRRRPPHSAACTHIALRAVRPDPTPASCIPQLDPHHRRLLSTPIPAGLDARPITDGAALKQNFALAGSGHVRDPAGARRTMHSAARRDPFAPSTPLHAIICSRCRRLERACALDHTPPTALPAAPRARPPLNRSASLGVSGGATAHASLPHSRHSKPQGARALAEGRIQQ
ncbi:hypothetical protein B0H14DRAFT_1628385 [Mycena olivaceomarginata]|nr:hypothetical protein B0H14DRAFT_1628385 [Mycena olivaceomarginata]